MVSKPIRTLVIDDSIFSQALIKKILATDDDIELVGTARSGIEGEKLIKSLSPDVVLTDIEMPGMSGIELVKKVMAENPVRFILISSMSISLFEALQAGAINYVAKPNMADKDNISTFSKNLISYIKEAARANLRASTHAVKRSSVAPASLNLSINKSSSKYKLIAMGASTGGTQTLSEILKELPENTPGIVVVQHMPAGFTKMFAQRLNQLCKMTVKEAAHGDTVQRGTVYIAPGGIQTAIKKSSDGSYFIRCHGEEKISGHCPSVDNLFTSVAACSGKECIGVILTGMGRDGAEGMLKMKQNGAYTIGQDEQSSIVYGMPHEAFKLGGVTKQLPYQKIAGEIVNMLNR